MASGEFEGTTVNNGIQFSCPTCSGTNGGTDPNTGEPICTCVSNTPTNASYPVMVKPEGAPDVAGTVRPNSETGALELVDVDGNVVPDADLTTLVPYSAGGSGGSQVPVGIELSNLGTCPVYQDVNGKPELQGVTAWEIIRNEDGSVASETKKFYPANGSTPVTWDDSQGYEKHSNQEWGFLELYCKRNEGLNLQTRVKWWGRDGDDSILFPLGSDINQFITRWSSSCQANNLPVETKLNEDFSGPNESGDFMYTPPNGNLSRIEDLLLSQEGAIPIPPNYVIAMSQFGVLEIPQIASYLNVSWHYQDAFRLYLRCVGQQQWKLVINQTHLNGTGDDLHSNIPIRSGGCYEYAVLGSDDSANMSIRLQAKIEDNNVSAGFRPITSFGTNPEAIRFSKVCAWICPETEEIRLGSKDGQLITLDNKIILDGAEFTYSKSSFECMVEGSEKPEAIVQTTGIFTATSDTDFTEANVIDTTILDGHPTLANGTVIPAGIIVPSGATVIVRYY